MANGSSLEPSQVIFRWDAKTSSTWPNAGLLKSDTVLRRFFNSSPATELVRWHLPAQLMHTHPTCINLIWLSSTEVS